jgi:putative ATP-binding cassette transporter
MLRSELPDSVIVSVSHRRAVELLHDQQLELLGGGEWRLGPVEKEPAQV